MVLFGNRYHGDDLILFVGVGWRPERREAPATASTSAGVHSPHDAYLSYHQHHHTRGHTWLEVFDILGQHKDVARVDLPLI